MILHAVKAIHVFCLNLQSSILRRHAVEYMYVSIDSDDQTCDDWQQRVFGISISKWLGARDRSESTKVAHIERKNESCREAKRGQPVGCSGRVWSGSALL